jgi:Histone H1-like protein Hc1
VDAYERIEKILADTREDLQKAKGGNQAAGTRVRKAMQDIKEAAQEVREKILETRNAGKTE